MLGVCFRREKERWTQDQWSWVFSNFGIEGIWERGWTDDKDLEIYQTVIPIEVASELPDYPLVVLAHQEGRYIQGVDSLVDFVHPDDAIYMFGGTHVNLSDEDDLGGRVPDHLIYIPSMQYDMYGHAAAYITLYDRLVKRGNFG